MLSALALAATLTAVVDWFQTPWALFGLSAPAWAWAAILLGLVAENILGRLKAPWAHSLLGVIAAGLRWLVTFTRIGSIPIVGTLLVRFLELVANIDLDGDGKIGDAAVERAREIAEKVEKVEGLPKGTVTKDPKD